MNRKVSKFTSPCSRDEERVEFEIDIKLVGTPLCKRQGGLGLLSVLGRMQQDMDNVPHGKRILL